jgi:hypothetical protein
VSDDQQADLIRRLREEGGAQAPDDLRAEVMAQVVAEPRRTRPHRRRLWRPVLAVGAVACALGGAAIGLSNLDGSSGASGSSSSAAADLEVASGATSALRSAGVARVYTLPAQTAAAILGRYAPNRMTATPAGTAKSVAGKSFKVTLPGSDGAQVERRLRIAARRWRAESKAASANQRTVRVIVRPPAATTGN